MSAWCRLTVRILDNDTVEMGHQWKICSQLLFVGSGWALANKAINPLVGTERSANASCHSEWKHKKTSHIYKGHWYKWGTLVYRPNLFSCVALNTLCWHLIHNKWAYSHMYSDKSFWITCNCLKLWLFAFTLQQFSLCGLTEWSC